MAKKDNQKNEKNNKNGNGKNKYLSIHIYYCGPLVVPNLVLQAVRQNL